MIASFQVPGEQSCKRIEVNFKSEVKPRRSGGKEMIPKSNIGGSSFPR
jgi:hypothetical protein